MFKEIAILTLLLAGSFPGAVSADFKLPDSGQTKCYQAVIPYAEIPCAGTGQDGEYGINPMSFTDNGNGTVTDNNTGLMWQKQDDNQVYNWYRASGTYNAESNPSSQNVCGSLALGGYNDWRLPSKKEFMTIPDYSAGVPTINQVYFPNTEQSGYWSSTPYYHSPGSAWALVFGGGVITYSSKENENFVRCVRGAQEVSTLTDNGNGTVSDSRTGRTWQQGESATMTWGDAISYCEGLSLGGASDWRLPDIKELESLTKDSAYGPAIDTSYFPGAFASCYWSSTSTSFDPATALYVNFITGGVSYTGKGGLCHARCVRGIGGALGTLEINFSGTGGGTVSGSGARDGVLVAFSTDSNTSRQFDIGTPVNIGASPAEFSLFSGWSGACSGTTDCDIVMSTTVDVTATFNKDTAHMTRIDDTDTYFPSLQAAYDGVPTGSTIKVWGTVFAENLNANTNKNVTIEGGYNSAYTSNNGYTTIQGTLTIGKGSITVENLVTR